MTKLKKNLLIFSLSMLIPFTSGCASLFKDRSLNEVQRTVQSRVEVTLQKKVPEQTEITDEIAQSLDKREIDLQTAIETAVINNPELQAVYEELGIAKADLLQATLFKNPRFEGHARVPQGGGRVNVELLVTKDIIDVLLMPLRRRVASAQFEETKLWVSSAVIDLVAEVKKAYYEAQASEQIKELQRKFLDAAEAALLMSRRMHEAGNVNLVDLGLQESAYEQTKVDFIRTETNALLAREPLNRLLGLKSPSTSWFIQPELPLLPKQDPDQEELNQMALNERLDYAAMQKNVQVRKRTLTANRFDVFSQMEAGFNVEREPEESEWVRGPMWAVDVPVFDWKQAVVSKNKAEIRRQQFKTEAYQVHILSGVRETYEKMISFRRIAERYRDFLIPTRQKLINEMQKHYNFMLIGVFQLLQAKQDEIVSEKEYIESLKEYWISRAELERAVGGKLPGLPQK